MKNKLALGTVQFGLDYGISNKAGITNHAEVEKILVLANKNGIQILDTAHAYGISEEVLGSFPLNHFKIVSKFIDVKNEAELINQFELSLQRLNVKRLYGYIAHRPLEIIDNPEIWTVLQRLKKENKIEKIGFSFNNVEELLIIKEKRFIPDLIQVPYNYLDERFEKEMISLKAEYNTEIHSRSTFLQGLFFKSPDELNPFFNPIKPILKELTQEDIAAQLLSFVLEKPFIDNVVLGVNTAQHLIENLNNSTKTVVKLKKCNITVPGDIITPSKWPK